MDYPRVFSRVKAVVIDSVVLVIFIVAVTELFSLFNDVPDFVRIVAFILIFGLYDPLMTSIFGGTIGHMIIGLRVKKEKNTDRNILFPFAVIRYLIKATLGWISLFTVMSDKKGKAIHDIVVKSVVIYDQKKK